MPDFRTLYEQKKWNDISNLDKQSLRRMADGQATEGDVRAIQNLISQYQSLVSSTFRAGLRTLKTAAEQRIQKIADHREALGKPELTESQFSHLLEIAVDKAWKSEGAEIAVLLESELEKSKDTQNDEIASLLDQKLAAFSPIPGNTTEDKVEEIATKIAEEHEEEPTSLLSEKMDAQQHLDEDDDTNFVPVTEDLIDKANKSADLTSDLQNELDDLKNPDKRSDREDSKIKKWWRAFKAAPGAIKRKGVGIITGLVKAVGLILATELLGGNLWDQIKGALSWQNIESVSGQIIDTGMNLLKWGWKTLSDIISLETIKKLVKQALVGGLDMMGTFGQSIKKVLGLSDDTPDPAKTPDLPGPQQGANAATTVPGPGGTPNVSSAGADQSSSDVPSGQDNPSPITTRFGPVTGASDTAPTIVPGPIQTATAGPITPAGAPDLQLPGLTKTEPNDATVKGSGTELQMSNAVPQSNKPSLGTAAQNEVQIKRVAEGTVTPANPLVGGGPTGGVRSTMQGFSLGQSVDGTLTMMNAGMLTQ